MGKKRLIKVTETYRLDNEKEAEEFLQELKANPQFELAKYSSTRRVKKSKGEIIDEWIRFEVTKIFNDEQEVNSLVEITYDVE